MSANKEAKISLRVDGGQSAKSEIDAAFSGLNNLSGIAGKATGALGAIGKAAGDLATDYGKAVSNMKPIDFAASAQGVRELEERTTRMALRAGASIEQVGSKYGAVGKAIYAGRDSVDSMARSLRDATNVSDVDTLAEAMTALGEEANDTDRSLEEMAGIGATFAAQLGVPLDRIKSQLEATKTIAASLSTVGGPVALQNTMVALAPLLERFNASAAQSSARIGALTQGLNQQQATRVGGQIAGSLQGLDPILAERFARKKGIKGGAYDEEGRLRDEVAEELQGHLRKAPYGEAAAVRMFGNDVQAARRFYNAGGKGGLRGARLAAEKELSDPKRMEPVEWDRGTVTGFGVVGEGMDEAALKALDEKSRGKLGLDGSSTSKFAGTAAARRIAAQQERTAVERKVGARVLRGQDTVDNMYRGDAETRAALETGASYLPGGSAALGVVTGLAAEGRAAMADSAGLDVVGNRSPSGGNAAQLQVLQRIAATLDRAPKETATAIKGLPVKPVPLGAQVEARKPGGN